MKVIIYFDTNALQKYSIATCITVYLVNESINGNIGRISDILCDKSTTLNIVYSQLNTNSLQELAKCIDLKLVDCINHNIVITDLAKQEILEINDISKKNVVEKDNNNYEEFFNDIWKWYPVKKGKGKVSKTQKMKLYRVGLDELSRCINRYVKYIEDNNKQKFIMNGSTFFNSGYIDYLDENYCEDSSKKESGFLQKVGL